MAVTAASLAGCGGGSEEDFCDSLQALSKTENLSLSESFDAYESLPDNAPSELEDDAEVLSDYFGGLREAAEDTDVDLDTPENELSEEDEAKLDEVLLADEGDQGQIDEAFTNMLTWTDENCPASE